jgi:hypothetical protein
MNLRKTLASFTLASALALIAVVSIPAQFMDMSGLVAANMAFDQRMQQQAADFSYQWFLEAQRYRAQTGYTGPILSGFDASTLSAANARTMAAYQDYNRSAAANSAATDQTLWNHSNTYRGNALYQDPYTGSVHNLSYQPDIQWSNGTYGIGTPGTVDLTSQGFYQLQPYGW